MQSSITLKHNIYVGASAYAAIFVFFLYSLIIIFSLLTFGISWLTLPLYICLFATALYGSMIAYQHKYLLKVSDSGKVEISIKGKVEKGIVSSASFYNGLFLFLRLTNNPNEFINSNTNNKCSIIVYRDAVSEYEYRLLARVINFGRD